MSGMRAYKFLSVQFGLKSLYERRLKIARVDELNDLFELVPFTFSDEGERWAAEQTRLELGKRYGVVCFSADWSNPVIWAHYSDKHRGVSLGFDIQDERTRPIKYVDEPEPFPRVLGRPQSEQLNVIYDLLYTKYSDWKYEHEIRTFTTLDGDEPELGVNYINFDQTHALVEVILGARCDLTIPQVKRALGDLSDRVSIVKARSAKDSFLMVSDASL
jgi:hypothetical protein